MSREHATYPLTHPQKRIWFVENIHQHTPIHHLIASSFKLGAIDFNDLEASLHRFIQENAGVRLRLIREQGEVRQYVGEWPRTPIPLKDFSSFPDPEEAFSRWIHEEAQRPFDGMSEFLFAFYNIRLHEHKAGYVFIFHHLIADGWSLTRMMNRIWELYASWPEPDKLPPPEEYPSYLDYLETEASYMASSRFAKHEAFWNTRFETLPEGLTVRDSTDTAGKRKSFLLEAGLSETLKQFAAEQGCSVNTFFVLLMLLSVQRTTGQHDLIIGTPVLNRSGRKEKDTFGMFTSTVPFRYRVDDRQTLHSLLQSVQEELQSCYFNQKYPYDLLVQNLQLQKKGYSALFDLCVNYYNTRMLAELDGDPIETTEIYSGHQMYALQMVIKDWRADGRLLISFDYKISEYTDTDIESMWEQLHQMMLTCLEQPSLRADELELVTPAAKRRLLTDWNRTEAEYPRDRLVHQLFEEQAARAPDRVALYKGLDRAMSYGELNAQANRLAAALRGRGIGRDHVVGLMAVHSPETIVAILAVLKAGGAYVPIDPGYPAERIRYLMEDSQAALLLTNVADSLRELDYQGDLIDLLDPDVYSGDGVNLEVVNEPQDLAYIIYTSGSTGRPKGVMISHRSLVNYSWWAKKHYLADPSESFAFYSSISFDLTVTSLFAPLINGNPIRVYADDDGTDSVLNRIVRDNATHVIKLTPAHLSLLKDGVYRHSIIRRFIVGGEDLKTSMLRSVCEAFGGHVEVYNEYGPTETTVGCMIHRFDELVDDGASVPIGRPADNVKLYILDAQLRLLPVGSIGELYVSGDGVARGYFNRNDLTQERFVPNPFVSGAVMYKTGDLARYRPDGVMEYLGRIDHQVKIRGYRIELSEIESRLLEHPLVKDAAVLDRTGPDGAVHLCVYYVSPGKVYEEELRSSLLGKLPHYMVPSLYGRLESLPLTPNGKVDRAALPPIAFPSSDGEEPVFTSELEQKVWHRYREVLQVERLGRRDHFYQLGGDSIKAIQIAGKLHEDGIRVKVKDILSQPYFAEVAASAEQMSETEAGQGPAQGEILPTPITEWFFSRKFANEHYWNQSVLLRMKQQVKLEEVRIILQAIVQHHDALRLSYNRQSGRLFYNPELMRKEIDVQKADLSSVPIETVPARLREIGTRLKSGLRLDQGLPLAACLFQTDANGSQMLLLTAHHLVIDVVSWGIVLDDFASLLDQIRRGERLRLPRKTHAYGQWAERLHQYARHIPEERELYWKGVQHDAAGCEGWPMTEEEASLQPELIADSVHSRTELTEEETAQLTGPANAAYRTETKDLLLLALALTVREYTHRDTVLIEVETHGREELFEDLDLTRTVGWFTSMYPCCLKLEGGEPGELIKQAKEQLRAVPAQGIDYGVLRYLKRSVEISSRETVRFNYVGDLDTGFGNDLFEYALLDSGAEHDSGNELTCFVDIVAAIVNKRLTLSTVYGRQSGEAARLHSLTERMAEHLRWLVQHGCSTDSPQFTPSDFAAAGLSQSQLDMLFG
ncbi:amino acid adenylation domain-containing protein [Paenibacillus filicis]|uniref:Amino acid adenylation domain-containing protein n=1 Tax=Paenibacillus filicis TaxID=669464 RepID=A0ABU9DEC3_9BACL